MKKINIQVVDNYVKLQEDLKNIIEGYGMKHSFIIKESGMSESTYFHKMKNKTFTPSEIYKIIKIVNRGS